MCKSEVISHALSNSCSAEARLTIELLGQIHSWQFGQFLPDSVKSRYFASDRSC